MMFPMNTVKFLVSLDGDMCGSKMKRSARCWQGNALLALTIDV